MSKQGLFHFEISERKVLLRLFDLIFISLSIIGLNFIFKKTYIYFNEKFWLWLLCYLSYFMFCATIFELYVLEKAESRFIVIKNLFLSLLFTTLLYLFTPYITPILPSNRFDILLLFLTNLAVLILWRFSYITFITSPRFYKRVLFVGENFNIEEIVNELKSFDKNYEIIGYIDTSQTSDYSKNITSYPLNDISRVINSEAVGEIVVANSFKGVSEDLYNELTPLLKTGIPIKSYSKVYEEITKRILLKDVTNNFYCYFPFSRSNQNKFYLFVNRLFDIIISILGLLLCIALIPIIFLINLFFNKGNLFYKQKRIGKFSKPFTIIKFRTMVKEAESHGAQWAKKNDYRITPFGRILRACRIDELPQFINIIKGEMSLIGPRPERPEFVEELTKCIPFYDTRHIIKPGLTGWAQVNAKYASTKDETLEKLQYDLFYIKERSLFLDFRILVKTISTVIFFKGY